jgi:Fe-S-cluster containining protein
MSLDEITFPCDKCAACCKSIGCPHLKDNLCEIYDSRPNVCNNKYVYEHFCKDVSWNEFVLLCKEYCAKLRGEYEKNI